MTRFKLIYQFDFTNMIKDSVLYSNCLCPEMRKSLLELYDAISETSPLNVVADSIDEFACRLCVWL